MYNGATSRPYSHQIQLVYRAYNLDDNNGDADQKIILHDTMAMAFPQQIFRALGLDPLSEVAQFWKLL